MHETEEAVPRSILIQLRSHHHQLFKYLGHLEIGDEYLRWVQVHEHTQTKQSESVAFVLAGVQQLEQRLVEGSEHCVRKWWILLIAHQANNCSQQSCDFVILQPLLEGAQQAPYDVVLEQPPLQL